MEPDEEADEGDLEFESSDLPGDDLVDVNDEILARQDDDSSLGSDSAAEQPEEEWADATPETSPPAAETASPVAPEDTALRQERISHPSRFSPITGARAPAGTFYLPWNPMPEPSREQAPEDGGLAPSSSEAPPSSAIPLPSPNRSPGQNAGAAASDDGNGLPLRDDIGQPLPRVQVTVSLAAARNLFEDALEVASREMADRFRKLALGEIESAAFRRRAEERAADYRLRGPTF